MVNQKASYKTKVYDLRPCRSDEITGIMYARGALHICFPTEVLQLHNNFDNYPENSIIFRVKPNLSGSTP